MGGAAADKWVLTLGFVLILSLSGLIAYVGDYIGRRIGRKRLTIFGLRPKNTAILFTVVTGMLISALATVTILLASEGARKRLLHYSETVSQLEAQANYQQQQRQQAERFAEIARRQKDQAELQLVTSQKAYTSAETARREAETRSRQAVALAAQTQRRVELARRELAAAQARRAQAEQRYLTAQAALVRAQREEGRARASLAQAQTNLAQTQGQVERLKTDLTALDRQRSQAQQALTRTQGELATATRELKSATNELVNATEEVLKQHKELEKLNNDLDAAKNEAERQRAIATMSLMGQVIVRSGQELARVRFPGGEPEPQAVADLDSFMRRVDRRALQLGASRDEQAGLYAVPNVISRGGQLIPGAAAMRGAMLGFLTRGVPVWLRAMAVANAVEGQPVYYTLVPTLEATIFKQGQVIASQTIDGRLDEAAIARALENLIVERVNAQAEKGGLLPNAANTYTRVPPEKWLPAVRAIKAAGKPVTVSVVAASAIRSGDPLDIDFRVSDEAHG